MVQSVNNNSLTLGLLANLNKAQAKGETAFERLSSGFKINSAADNAAGLAIVERFIAQLTGFEQASRNASDGISFTQVAESGLSSISEDLQRIRELSIQAANGSLSDNDRQFIQAEVSQLQEGINQTLETTRFNGVDVLTSDVDVEFQVGSNANDTVTLSLENIGTELVDLASIDVSTQAGAQDALAIIDQALEITTEQAVGLGATQNRLESTVRNLQNNIVNTEAAKSRVLDTDFGKSVSELIKSQIQQQAGIAVQSQANINAQLTLQLLQ